MSPHPMPRSQREKQTKQVPRERHPPRKKSAVKLVEACTGEDCHEEETVEACEGDSCHDMAEACDGDACDMEPQEACSDDDCEAPALVEACAGDYCETEHTRD